MKHLIVNGDDFGMTKGVNKAILECYKNGILRSTTMMCNMPFINDAVEISELCPELGFGIHITLDAGKPVLAASSINTLVDDNGNLKRSLIETMISADIKHIRLEIEAQLLRAFSLGINITHIDSHHHCINSPKVLEVFMELAKKYRLPVRCSQKERNKIREENIRTPNEFISSFYDNNATEEKLIEIIYGLENETSELMTHPAYCDEELLKISSYNLKREYEMRILQSKKVLDVIKAEGIFLSNYAIFK